ncbi:MAG: glycosyltransferase [Lachnospiraceae bacterium]|nr:glycosyltransferase [Lachnospiraceae bacterium]
MKKVGVSGHFGIGLNMLNGQTIKTKIVTNELKHQLGDNQVAIVDTHGGVKSMPRMFIQSWKLFRDCENIVMFPAYKGLQIFTPLYSFYNLFFHRKLQYVVIGGWLDTFIDKHSWLTGMLKKYDGIFVETTTMKCALEKKGFDNIVVMPNFKNISILESEELNYEVKQPYKLCTFSRVMKEKGIEDAVETIKRINKKSGHTVFCLDIYGQVDSKYEDVFVELQKNFPDYIHYKGIIEYDKSVETLKNYFALLFPTHFFTEGIPGTVIDAYAAGIPIIASKWESFSDIINDNVTGIGYSFMDNEELENILLYIKDHPEMILEMKKNCLIEAEKYIPNIAIKTILTTL